MSSAKSVLGDDVEKGEDETAKHGKGGNRRGKGGQQCGPALAPLVCILFILIFMYPPSSYHVLLILFLFSFLHDSTSFCVFVQVRFTFTCKHEYSHSLNS